MSQAISCHPKCQASDPRRVILCNCSCDGRRHGEAWVEEHGVDEIRRYYHTLEARWAKWESNSRARALKIRAMSGGRGRKVA